jgi:FAD-linked sulfhydryl oxidase
MTSKPVFPPMGMSPDVWGPLFWRTMHIVSLGYNTEPSKREQEDAIRFYKSLETMLPCGICRAHYTEFLKEMPVEQAVGSRDDLIYWVFQLHNKVNANLGKRQFTFDEYIQSMRQLAASDTSRWTPSPSNIALLFLLAAIVGGAVYYSRSK